MNTDWRSYLSLALDAIAKVLAGGGGSRLARGGGESGGGAAVGILSAVGDERRLLVVVAASEPRGASVVFFLRLGAIEMQAAARTAHVCSQARSFGAAALIYQLKTQSANQR